MIAEILERVAGENSLVAKVVSAALNRTVADSCDLKDSFAAMTAANQNEPANVPVVSREFNSCALAKWKRPVIFKDSFFSNQGPRLKISRRIRLERSVFRAFRNDK